MNQEQLKLISDFLNTQADLPIAIQEIAYELKSLVSSEVEASAETVPEVEEKPVEVQSQE